MFHVKSNSRVSLVNLMLQIKEMDKAMTLRKKKTQQHIKSCEGTAEIKVEVSKKLVEVKL